MDNGSVTQGSVMWGRQSWVGLQSASMGKLTLGRQYNFVYGATDNADPFHLGLGSLYTSGMISTVGGSRLNNAVVYNSPKLGPILPVSASHSTVGERPKGTATMMKSAASASSGTETSCAPGTIRTAPLR